jgi:NitT/TauT family transport system substrate-binding protein
MFAGFGLSLGLFEIRRALWAALALLLCSTIADWPLAARADEKITYLFPAPPILPAFGPIQIAKGKGYFSQAGLDVNYAVGRGGVDVAKEVGAGNVPLGGIVADGPIVVRQNGVPVKIVALFGGKGFMQLVVRADSGIQKPADLKGKTITVMSYQDTTFYALLGLLASAGLTQNDVDIQAAGPVGVWQFVATGKSVGMAGRTGFRRSKRPAFRSRYCPRMSFFRTWRRPSPRPIGSSRISRSSFAISSRPRCTA